MLDLNIMLDLNMDLNMLDLNMLQDLSQHQLLFLLLLLKDLLLLKEQPWLLKLLLKLPRVVGMERAMAATMVERAKEVKAVKDEDMVAKGTVGMADMAADMAKIQPLQRKVNKEKDTREKMQHLQPRVIKEKETNTKGEQAIKENRKAIK